MSDDRSEDPLILEESLADVLKVPEPTLEPTPEQPSEEISEQTAREVFNLSEVNYFQASLHSAC